VIIAFELAEVEDALRRSQKRFIETLATLNHNVVDDFFFWI
jgi:hypothetical protein